MVQKLRRLIALACVGASLYQVSGRAQSESDRDRAKAGVVMIQTKLPTGSAIGAGIVVAASAQDVYIVTADHLLRHNGTATEVRVQFSPRRGEWFDARILDLRDADLDLAALAVRLPPSVAASMFKGPGAVPASLLSRGSDVYALGYPGQRAWDLPVAPDKVASTSSVKLIFQSQYVRPGNSGGALLDACGRIAGMVIISDPPDAEAIRIESVLEAVARWALPSPLLTIQPASPCGSSAAAPPPSNPATPSRGSSIDEIRRLHEQEHWAESLPLLNRLVADQPSVPELFALRSHAYSHLERHAEAIADGEQAVRLGPNAAEAYLRRGEAKAGSGKAADALVDYDKALRLSPKEFEAFVNRGATLLDTREFQKAVDAESQALRLRTDRYEPWAVRANAYIQLNNQTAAISDLTQAIALRPSEAGLYIARAGAYYQTKQLEPALNDANQALRLKADDPVALVTRGAIYMALNRRDSARDDLTFALRLRPGMPEATSMLNALDKSAPASAAPLRPEPTPPAGAGNVTYARLIDQTVAALRGSRIAEANTLLDQMIGLDPSRPEAFSIRGAMLVDTNNLTAAYEAYQAALGRGGAIFFRLAHDHGNGLPPCVGAVAVSPAGVRFMGENGGHQLEWPLNAISEIAINDFYGMALGMLHVKTQAGRRTDTYNFVVVRAGEQQIVNRRPEAVLLVSLVNRLKQTAAP